ncbi:CDCP2-like protein [Mya arenaria]|uniref:CDCP2-like protein n=1 Tax=Mya arenaria TaxID=6604 RepID=A0ABY7GDH1_MYAAR|nr:CDCP2-like protein [Mya arenaria]
MDCFVLGDTENVFRSLYRRVPGHYLAAIPQAVFADVTVDECARSCVDELAFECQSFDVDNLKRECHLHNHTHRDPGIGLQYSPEFDHYRNGPISRFINYGHGGLQTVEGVQTHNKIVLGVNLDACAQLCLAETSFSCESFDYVFSEQSCQLSQYIAANVYGIRTVFEPGYRVMHYELIGEYLEHFYPTPYASVPGRNDRELRKVTPETCARKCLQEKEFVCRSFDYQIQRGTCLLSHVTGSDAGGLYTPEGVGVHHFEMKPTLDCGGSLAGERGGLASPNWPRNYLHHLNCTWTISVQAHKIIRLSIHHLDLGWRPGDWCSQEVDSLTVTEVADQGRQSTCIDGESRELSTLTNTASVNFVTNSDRDAQGFRIFYTADWPCNTTYMDDQGQFASPRWPGMYPANSACNWTLVAPFGGQLAMTGDSNDNKNHDVIKLTAIFVEPDMRNEFGDKNNSVLFDGETGDDIGRNVPDVTRADTGSRDTRAIFVGVLAAFVSMVAVMMLAFLFACRYYSAVPEAGFVDEDDVDEAARLPLPWPFYVFCE